jgi:hypothetical protein
LVVFVENPVLDKMLLGVLVACFEVGFKGGVVWKCLNRSQNNSYKSACTLCNCLADRCLVDETGFVGVFYWTSGRGWRCR